MEKSIVSSVNNLILYFFPDHCCKQEIREDQEQSLEGLLIQYLGNQNKNHLVPPVVFYYLNNFVNVTLYFVNFTLYFVNVTLYFVNVTLYFVNVTLYFLFLISGR